MKLSEANKKEMCKKYGECETCPFDSTFSAIHWMQRGYFCKIDDFKRGLIEDQEIEEPPAELLESWNKARENHIREDVLAQKRN